MKKSVVIALVSLILIFSFPVFPVDGEIEPVPLPVCGNGICEAGSGELDTCPADCEGRECFNPTEMRCGGSEVIVDCNPASPVCSSGLNCVAVCPVGASPCNAGICLGEVCGSSAECPAGLKCLPGCFGDQCTESGSGSDTCSFLSMRSSGISIGECVFRKKASCNVCSIGGGSIYDGAWGDYGCTLAGRISCKEPLADFFVNSCDGSSGCCGSSQSSCINADECGRVDSSGNLVDKSGVGYAGGVPGICRDKCNPASDVCRTDNGGQSCVSCAYRPDLRWISLYGVGNVWSTLYVASGVWVDDASCGAAACSQTNGGCAGSTSNAEIKTGSCASGLTCVKCNLGYLWDSGSKTCAKQCIQPNGGCALLTTNALTKPEFCDVELTCVNCNQGYYFGRATKTCMPGCDTLGGEGCSSDLSNAIDLGQAECTVSATDRCVKCSTGYVYDSRLKKCVLGCTLETEACEGGLAKGCSDKNAEGKDMYCAKTDPTTIQGNCCPKGYYWDPFLGMCQGAQVCGTPTLCPNPKKPTQPGLPKGDTSLFWYTGLCFRLSSDIATPPHKQACVTTDAFGLLDKFYTNVKVLDKNGNVVSGS